MKKTLSPWFATLVLVAVCCVAGRFAQSRAVFTARSQDTVEEKASPPAMLSIAGGALVLLGLVRRRHAE